MAFAGKGLDPKATVSGGEVDISTQDADSKKSGEKDLSGDTLGVTNKISGLGEQSGKGLDPKANLSGQ